MNNLNPKFILTLHPTYFNMGFFNVTVEFERYFGLDNEPIEIICQNNINIINGKINRMANKNHTPRIIGGRELKHWFNNESHIGRKIEVEIINKNKISMKITNERLLCQL